jgi:membrane protease YdiL (CAAX protease family)
LVVFGLFLGVALWASRAPRDFLLLRWRGGFWPVPQGIAYSVALRVALGVLLGVLAIILVLTGVISMQKLQDFFLANRPDVEAVVDVTALRNNPVYFWLTLTLVSFVVAGLREELWRSAFLAGARGLWPSRFSSRKGQFVVVVLAAVIFGLGHAPQGPIAICLTGLLGLGLGAIMVFHQSIWPAVIAHGLFDATSLAALPWALENIKGFQK